MRLRRIVLVAGLASGVVALATVAQAQVVDTFQPDADDYTYAIALQPDGKVLVGGSFTKFGCPVGCPPTATVRNRIARLNADGSVDPTFNPGASGPVYGILVQPDGRIVAFGNFTSVGGGTGTATARKFIARFNSDGSVDPTFDPGATMNLPPLTMALQADGKLVAGGQFTVAGGADHYFIVRLNSNGSVDSSFASGANGHVYSLAIQPDGKIVLGGVFTFLGGTFGDTARNRIGRLNANGSLDAGFNPGADNAVQAVAIQTDGRIVIGGDFLGVGGGTGTVPRNRLARLETNGAVDATFAPGANSTVYAFALQSDGRILVGGNFGTIDGNTRNRIARLTPEGTLDATFDPGASSTVYGMAIQPDGNIVVGGAFTDLGGGTGTSSRRYVGRILNSDPPVQSLTVTDGGATITWLRNSTAPALGRADFAMSTDGVTYSPIGASGGAGAPIAGGWRVTAVALPVNPNLTIRLRGYYQTGLAAGSHSMLEWIVPVADFNTVENGDFSLGLSGWLFFATPDQSYIDHNVTDGVLNFFRKPPPPGTSNQAVAFQQTGVPLGANVPLIAEFDLANSSSVRKRISVLIHDADFTDLSVCTFWLPANMPLQAYAMRTHTTKAWANLTISFYAASVGSNGGAYQIDNVSVRYAPTGSTIETICEDPLAPAPPGGADGPSLLVNGDFSSGAIAPGWGLFGQISGSVVGGVFQFAKLSGTPSGVILQATGQAMIANQILTATFDLGNTSAVRKRVTVLLHDNNFSDLSACTFWLAPGQPLSTYSVRSYATQAWANATLSVYPATVGTIQDVQLDNASFKRTPSATISGTDCFEPSSNFTTLAPEARQSARLSRTRVGRAGGLRTPATAVPIRAAMPVDHAVTSVTPVATTITFTAASGARLRVESWLASDAAQGEIQVSTDGETWHTVSVVVPSEHWTPIALDLDADPGARIAVRFVLHGAAKDTWWLRGLTIDTR